MTDTLEDLKVREEYITVEQSFWCDKEMVPVIKLLNRKGYPTLSCFAGHENGEYCYILFSPMVIIGKPPKGFILDIGYKSLAIRARKGGFIRKNIDSLMSWAESLKEDCYYSWLEKDIL